MKPDWLYDQGAFWIVVVLLAASLVAFDLAYRSGRRWHADTHDAGREVYVALKVALLGLLALLLAFAFGMAADRYSERQRLVTEEANILHRLLLCGSLLPSPVHAQFQKSFRKFVDARLDFFDAGQNIVAVEEAIDRTENLHGQLWAMVKVEAQRDPAMKGLDGMMGALNDEWSVHRRRVHAFEDRVPDGVIFLLFVGTILALATVGFAGGIANHPMKVGKWLLIILIGTTIFVVLDLDRPRRGIFRISQEPIVHFKELLNREDHPSP
jgi:hypothetical protein